MNKLPITERSLGETEIHWLLWRKTGTLNHSALRRYYMTRNHILLAKEYIFSEPSWVLVTYIGSKALPLRRELEKSSDDLIRKMVKSDLYW